jgi:hypothetical protein
MILMIIRVISVISVIRVIRVIRIIRVLRVIRVIRVILGLKASVELPSGKTRPCVHPPTPDSSCAPPHSASSAPP